jgi:hypothetical protein
MIFTRTQLRRQFRRKNINVDIESLLSCCVHNGLQCMKSPFHRLGDTSASAAHYVFDAQNLTPSQTVLFPTSKYNPEFSPRDRELVEMRRERKRMEMVEDDQCPLHDSTILKT